MADSKPDNKLSTPVMIVAVIILIAFIAMTYYLYTLSSSAEERHWTRLVYLYGGIEALAFSAAGYLFGREVHRQQAENAEKRADQKDQEAATAKQKGTALAAAVLQASRGRPPGLREEEVAQGMTGGTVPAGDLNGLAALASSLYPEIPR